MSRNVETSNPDKPPAAVMKNQKRKESGELLPREQGKMFIADWVADTLKG